MEKKRKAVADPLDDVKGLIQSAAKAGDDILLVRYAKALAKLQEKAEEALRMITNKKHMAGDASVKTCPACGDVITGAEKKEVCGAAEYNKEYEVGCGKLFHTECMKETLCDRIRLCRRCMDGFECFDCYECGTQH